MRSTEEHLAKLVAERHSDVRSKLEVLLNALASNAPENVQAANAQLDDSLNELGKVVAREHWPNWLSDLMAHTTNYRTNHANGHATWIAHLKSVMSNASAIESHVWFSNNDAEAVFDVDELIESARAAFKIDELFDRILVTLSELAVCEELDSSKAIRDLEKVIGILRRAKYGTFAAQFASWQFVRRFVPNLISSYLKSSDIAGPIIAAFEQTAEELDMGLENAKVEISEKLLAAAQKGFQSQALNGISSDQIPSLPME